MTKYNSVQEMLDDTGEPDFAEDFRKHMAKPFVRLKKFFSINWAVLVAFVCRKNKG